MTSISEDEVLPDVDIKEAYMSEVEARIQKYRDESKMWSSYDENAPKMPKVRPVVEKDDEFELVAHVRPRRRPWWKRLFGLD